MPWARLDDSYFTNRKTAGLSMAAKLMDLAGIAYSARELRDGVLSKRDVRVVAAQVEVDDLAAVLSELVNAVRWSALEEGAYEIHDYLDYNPSREQVLRERDEARERMARIRAVRNGTTENIEQTSAEVRPNNERTDDEHPGEPGPKFSFPVPIPVPLVNPVPYPDPTTARAGARAREAPKVDDKTTTSYDELAANWQRQQARTLSRASPPPPRPVVMCEICGERESLFANLPRCMECHTRLRAEAATG